MTTGNLDWIKLTKEDAIEPDLPICDAHHHLWDFPDDIPDSQVRYPHARHYLLKDFLQDLNGGHNVLQTVFNQCNAMYRKNGPPELQPVGETEFVQGIAAQSASGMYGKTAVAAGIIGFIDLTLGSKVVPVIEAQLIAGKNRFRGIRYISTWDSDPVVGSFVNSPHFLSNPKFLEGFVYLHKYNLSFDAWLYHTQLLDVFTLARAFPETPIILNHAGGPIGIGPYAGKRDEVLQDWKKGMELLATCPNIMVKVGGLGMPRNGFDWNTRPTPPDSTEVAKGLEPYINWCIEHFGTDRCIFESNFPVDRMSYSYTVIWNAFKRITKNFSKSERIKLFHDNACRAYRLEPD